MEHIIKCIQIIIKIINKFTWYKLIGLLLIPFVSASLNIYVNYLLINKSDEIILCMICKGTLDWMTSIVQQSLFGVQVRNMFDQLKSQLQTANYKCGIVLPGSCISKYNDLLDNCHKLRDFLFVLPMLYTSIVNFFITIYMMKTGETNYPVRLFFTIFCICMCGTIAYLTDSSVYESTPPSSTSITKIRNAQYVRIKCSMGCVPDPEYENNKRMKREEQQNIQKYAILLINQIITYISLISKNVSQLHTFGNISWMIGCLADNIKSFQYYTYVDDFLNLLENLEKHTYAFQDPVAIDLISVTTVQLLNVSFGYWDDNLTTYKTVINELTFCFKAGYVYHLESINGSGKTTLGKLWIGNIIGEILFGEINRKNISFTDICRLIFYVYQPSEYCPSFLKEEIERSSEKDKWLANELGVSTFFTKDMSTLSGGQKMRLLIYLALVSDSPIIWFDESLSEQSRGENGFLEKVVNALLIYEERKNKIIIIVGHGLGELFSNRQNVVNLKIDHIDGNTVLTQSESTHNPILNRSHFIINQ